MIALKSVNFISINHLDFIKQDKLKYPGNNKTRRGRQKKEASSSGVFNFLAPQHPVTVSDDIGRIVGRILNV